MSDMICYGMIWYDSIDGSWFVSNDELWYDGDDGDDMMMVIIVIVILLLLLLYISLHFIILYCKSHE